jgi:hypothetical protein
LRERERNRAQVGGEFLIRQSSDEYAAIDIGQVRNRLGALLRPSPPGAGAFGNAALAKEAFFNGTSENLPAASNFKMAGAASGPRPRETDRKTFPLAGFTTKSLIATSRG